MDMANKINKFLTCIINERYNEARFVFNVSLDFLHDGIDFNSFLLAEESAFSGAKILGVLKKGINIIVYEQVYYSEKDAQHVVFGVYDANGKFVYEDNFGFRFVDNQFELCGNQRSFEIVAKLHIDPWGGFHRAAGIRLNTGCGLISSVIPRTNDVDNIHFNFKTMVDDGFHALRFDIKGDDFKTREIQLKITASGKRPVNEQVRFRGVNHACFERDLWPVITGKCVHIPKMNMHPWALGVGFDNGDFEYMSFPGDGKITFCQKVISATLTDSLDNDWEVILNA